MGYSFLLELSFPLDEIKSVVLFVEHTYCHIFKKIITFTFSG